MFSFIETKLFSQLREDYLPDEEYAKLQEALIERPERGGVDPWIWRSPKVAMVRIWAWETRGHSGHLLCQGS